jgi:serine/threonine protein kinase
MTLSASTRPGPHEIVALMGAGGMGEAYGARDTRLGRDGAIKVLSANPELRTRSERDSNLDPLRQHPRYHALLATLDADG